MLITQFIRDRSDVELERLTREGTLWDYREGSRSDPNNYTGQPGCLLCNTFRLRTGEYWRLFHRPDFSALKTVESYYINLAARHGDARVGALIARLARRELGRRALAAIGTLASPTPATAEATS